MTRIDFPRWRYALGIHLLLLGGIPGTGVKSVGTMLRGCFEMQNVAVDQIDDDSFHVFGPTCEVCSQVEDTVGRSATHCWDNPIGPRG